MPSRPVARGAAPRARATVTRAFLFSDLRGYTDFVEAHGDAAAARGVKCYHVLPMAKRRAAARVGGRAGRTMEPVVRSPRGRERVGVRELRQNLSVHLRRVERGEILEVTDRGRPVAVLGPLPERMTPLQRLVAEGRIVRRATVRLEDLGPPLKVKLAMPLSQALEEIRADRI